MLVDGARHQLDLIRTEAARRKVTIHILVDFIHVLEYVWRAAWCFYQDADPAAEPWVAGHALRILAGEVDTVIAALNQQATDADLTPQQRGGVDTCTGYLQAKRELLSYHTALARGWPIATGVIEGACRHLIGDRLDITGARWACKAPKPSSSSAPYAATATSPPTGATTCARNTDASTKPATSSHPPVQPDQPVPEMEPHPSRIQPASLALRVKPPRTVVSRVSARRGGGGPRPWRARPAPRRGGPQPPAPRRGRRRRRGPRGPARRRGPRARPGCRPG